MRLTERFIEEADNMRCPNCGAEIGNSDKCEYCGSYITSDMKKEQEILNKKGCPKCGSTNIKFSRENHGEVQGKGSKKIVHKTVGVCNDCGHTWYPDVDEPKKRKTWLWVLGWVFIFPVPLTILMLRKKDMKPAIKYGIIAAAWIIYLIIGLGGNSSNKTPSPDNTAVVAEQTKETEAAEIKEDNKQDVTEKNSPEKTQAEEHAEEPAEESTEEQEESETEEEATDEEEKSEEPSGKEESVPAEYLNALKKGKQYSAIMHMSKQGIYDQLTSEYGEGFPEDAAQYAIDNLDEDWEANALVKAKEYSDTMHMSKRGIYDQLISEYGEKFTEDEAEYAVDNVDADWNENALAKAKEYQDLMSMSNSAIYDQLTSEYGEKFTDDEAQYAVDHLE